MFNLPNDVLSIIVRNPSLSEDDLKSIALVSKKMNQVVYRTARYQLMLLRKDCKDNISFEDRVSLYNKKVFLISLTVIVSPVGLSFLNVPLKLILLGAGLSFVLAAKADDFLTDQLYQY